MHVVISWCVLAGMVCLSVCQLDSGACGPLNMHTPVAWLPVWWFTSTYFLLVLLWLSECFVVGVWQAFSMVANACFPHRASPWRVGAQLFRQLFLSTRLVLVSPFPQTVVLLLSAFAALCNAGLGGLGQSLLQGGHTLRGGCVY